MNSCRVVAIGEKAAYNGVGIKDCIFIGNNTGSDILKGENIIILGDNIKDLDDINNAIIFQNTTNYTLIIGETIFGEPNSLYHCIKTIMKDRKQ